MRTEIKKKKKRENEGSVFRAKKHKNRIAIKNGGFFFMVASKRCERRTEADEGRSAM